MDKTSNHIKNYLNKSDDFFISPKNINNLINLSENIDSKLIEYLIADESSKNEFFSLVNDSVYVFNQNRFIEFCFNILNMKNNSDNVRLSFPHKNDILISDMDKEDDLHKLEFFYTPDQIDEINHLKKPKVVGNPEYFSFDGESLHHNTEYDKKIIINNNLKENLILKGNNLLGLYTLSNYIKGIIDMIYIDPPYFFNKKKAADSFEYNSNFKLSTWLTFMKNRLEVAKELMSEHGVIFISMSEDGTSHLKILCDEIFGSNNLISNMVWRNTGQQQNNGKNIVFVTESILCYAKNNNGKNINKVKIEDRKGFKAYRYTETEGKNRGKKFRVNPIQDHTLGKHKFSITHKLTGEEIHLNSRVKEDDLWKLDSEGLIYWGDGRRSTLPQKKKYLDSNTGVLASNMIEGIYYEKSNQELEKLFGVKNLFSYSKPKDLISYLIELGSNKDSVILDFFAGSGTTGHSTLEVNKKDGGNRKFILLEQMDYIKTITRERILLAMKEYNLKGSFLYLEMIESDNKNIKRDIKSITKKEQLLDYIKGIHFIDNEKARVITKDLNLRDSIQIILNTFFTNRIDYCNFDEKLNIPFAYKEFTL